MNKKAIRPPKVMKLRSIDEVNQEYSKLCAEAGDIQYKIERFPEDLKRINLRLQQLNQEARAIQAEHATQKPALAEKAAQ